MRPKVDAIVIGAGPAGAGAAFHLARAGARTLLLDRAAFPRDKACGDLIGPRAVRELETMGVALDGGVAVPEMLLLGPRGRAARLPTPRGNYPPAALSISRMRLDATIMERALAGGAQWRHAEVKSVSLEGEVELRDGERLRADFVVGADGSLSRTAQSCGLAEGALWSFALRFYADAEVDMATIALWTDSGRTFPGYGWIFPVAGGANLGLGVSSGRRLRGNLGLEQQLPRFLRSLHDAGMAPPAAAKMRARRGAWLKMGMPGQAARGRVLLAGDAAGLVNPLQGEGIAEALVSGRLAAEAITRHPGNAAAHYQAELERDRAFYRQAAFLQQFFLAAPWRLKAAEQLLTAPLLGSGLSAGWATYWNNLAREADFGASRAVARLLGGISQVASRFN